MRILAYTPEHPDYGIRPQAHDSIRAALSHYDGPIDWLVGAGDNPKDTPFENVTYHHNKARDIVLDQGYDAFLSIESDMIVTDMVVEDLLKTGADIAYGLYIWRHRPYRWSAYKMLDLWGGESLSYDYNGNDVRASWGKIIDVAGFGMGCTLIKRNVLEQIKFRLHDGTHSWIVDEYAEQFKTLGFDPYEERRNMVCDDWLLAMDAAHYGFTQRCNLAVVCGHIDYDIVFWPDVEEKSFFRMENIKEI